MSVTKRNTEFIDTRLDTWKSIAQYLGRSSRTAQRWHREYGLPVRHLGGDASSVFAYTDELNRWLRDRDRNATGESFRSEQPTSASVISPRGQEEAQAGDYLVSDRSSGESERRAKEIVGQAQRLWESLSSANLSRIARLYREATDLDPSSALAFAGLSQTLIAQAVLGRLHPLAALLPAEAALGRALEIDPGLSEAICAQAMIGILKHDWVAARKDIDEEILRQPAKSQALVGRALFAVAQGSLTEASQFLRCASIEKPLNTSVAELLCWVEYLTGNFDSALALVRDARETGHDGAILDSVEALCRVLLAGPAEQIEHLESMVAGAPRNYTLLGVLGYAYACAGRRNAARDLIESMTHVGLSGRFDFAYAIALTHLGLDESTQALHWLDESYKDNSLWSLGFQSDPILARVRTQPVSQALFGPDRYPKQEFISNSSDLQQESMPFSA